MQQETHGVIVVTNVAKQMVCWYFCCKFHQQQPVLRVSVVTRLWLWLGCCPRAKDCIFMLQFLYPAPVGVRNILINLSVCICVSVCPPAYLWNRWTNPHKILYAYPLWPLLSPPPVALCYVVYFGLSMTSRLAVMGTMPKGGGCTVQRRRCVMWWYRGGVWCLWMLVNNCEQFWEVIWNMIAVL